MHDPAPINEYASADEMEPHFVQSPTILATDVGEYAVVVTDIDLSTYFGLDNVGAVIWKELAEPKRVSEIVQTLVATYEIDAKQCHDEITHFVETLLAKGLVKKRTFALRP